MRSGGGTVGSDGVVARYRALAAAGDISEDAAQLGLAGEFDRLALRLSRQSVGAGRRRPLGRLVGRRRGEPLKGLYIHGAVGRGKTMLMDAFFAAVAIEAKRRDHFHAFMADVHDRIHAFRAASRAGEANGNDPIAPVAAAIAGETRLLCLDEFNVEDIADAMILSRLFTALFAKGLVLVATSNTAPEDLYLHGLNRPLFLPFVDVLKAHAAIVALDGPTDYRLARLGESTAYVTPDGAQARSALDGLWRSLAGGAAGEATSVRVKGRDVAVPRAANRVARFSFAELCEAPLGASDFAAIADAFDTVVIDGIPVIPAERRDVARRFINLVDVFYDRGVRLVVSAAAEPAGLYPATDGREAFAFRRTISRLIEMRSAAYLSASRGRSGAEAPSSVLS